MKISWYPWQIFIRKWEMVTPIIFGLGAALIIGGGLVWGLRSTPQPIFLHYSIELGIDEVGGIAAVFWLPGILLCFIVSNILLANVYTLPYRWGARLILWSIVPLVLAAGAFAVLLLLVNGVWP